MKIALHWKLVTLCAALSTPAHAQMYRCQVGGSTVYQQVPCPGGKEIKAPSPPTPEDSERANIELAISRKQVVMGMTAQQVVRSWGEPTKINRSVSSNRVHEQWVYRRGGGNDQYLYLDNGILVSAQGPG